MKRDNNISFNVALGGVCAALAVVLMLITAIIPVLDFAMPAVAGFLMAVIVIEINKKWAVITYVAVSLVSLLVVPTKEVGVLFALFFGYYPILKALLEKPKNMTVQWLMKLAVFNVAVICYYFLAIKILTGDALMSEAGELGKFGPLVLLAVANVVFVMYDIALTRMISMYYNWFRKKFLRR
ncbi:MAG: hypothetical protein IJ031_05205 [Oscillospiraceae bacterium]|nr:hypothetical protein [Oscillospiraceae bacterium]MBQ8883973.1 hypothetical protein [Oscillospiraceae bacterium]